MILNNEQKFPLTKQQQGLWIEWKLHPNNTSYNTCVKVKLKGSINTERLSQALKDIVQYFESLRVYFTQKDNHQWVQISRPVSELECAVFAHDLTSLSKVEQQMKCAV